MAAIVDTVPASELASAERAAGTRPRWEDLEGWSHPLGVSWVPEARAYNFALYSKHAHRVCLLLYRPDELARPVRTIELDFEHHKTGRIWHCRVPQAELGGARYYAYLVDGPPPEGRFEWHAFDPEKVLLDPYSRAVRFPDGFDAAAASAPGSNAGRAPLGVIPAPTGAEEGRPRPHPPLHQSDAIVYELHVRNFTRHPSSGVSAARRGTFAGIVEKIPYLVALGVTVVELMPVFQYDPSGRDRWGYMPLDFFAPHHDYASTSDLDVQAREFRDMVDALHAAGLEVVLDVVYNHTCERGSTGPVYSYKGIDNSTYYLSTGDAAEPWSDYAGTGNTMNCANRAVRKLILDSMRYWARDMGVDGFRFDLASIYARGQDGAVRYGNAPIFGEISGAPDLSRLRLIAEPWDAVGATALGRDFPGMTWHQWNAAFRDDVRRFVRGDPGLVPALMRRLYGSDDLFPDDREHAYRPIQSVNYVTCHDGFTLYDLVSYDRKRNWANGHDNLDGPANNFSWNCGWEGDDRVPPEITALRARQAKNLVLLPLLANGTPMLRAGDEFLATQGGNDNPYNQDNEASWLDWRRLDANREMFRFVQRCIAFRKEHPSLARSRFWRHDVSWYGTAGPPDLGTESRSLALCLHGASEGDDDLYVMINAWQEPLTFELQEGSAGDWRRAIDTARSSPDDACDAGEEAPLGSLRCVVAPRSIVVCVRPPTRAASFAD